MFIKNDYCNTSFPKKLELQYFFLKKSELQHFFINKSELQHLSKQKLILNFCLKRVTSATLLSTSTYKKRLDPLCNNMYPSQNKKMTEWKSLSREDDMCTICFSAESAPDFPRKREVDELCSLPPPPHTLWLHPQTAPIGIEIGYRGGR